MKYAAVLVVVLTTVQALDNGLARTPPMGWLDWERFRCNIDCKDDPDNCIGENLFKAMADHMVADGYKDVGYEYVNIDDCWLSKERDANFRLQPDPARFPNGIKALADYIHGKGLKLGIYEDFGTKTCGGFPGSEFYMSIDAQTFADWGVDLLKFDGCYSSPTDMDIGYPLMGQFLNKTGRPILYSCSWPAYITLGSKHNRPAGGNVTIKGIPPYDKIAKACNIWRNYGDIQDSWESVVSIIQFYGKNLGNFSAYAGPGHFNDPDMPNYTHIAETCNIWRNYFDVQDSWDSIVGIIQYYGSDKDNFSAAAGPGGWNDPDMLILGDFSLSVTQQKAQMAMWSMMASPLFMSNDLRSIPPESKAILQNRNVIKINQDPMGIQGRQIISMSNMDVWTRPVMPKGNVALAILNRGTAGSPSKIELPIKVLGSNAKGYNITEVFDQKPLGMFKLTDTISLWVDPAGVLLATATAL